MTMQEVKLRGHNMRWWEEMTMHEVKLKWQYMIQNKRLHNNAWSEMKMALNKTKWKGTMMHEVIQRWNYMKSNDN